jgi:hypothetical protein
VLLIIGASVIGLSTAMKALNAGHQGDDITIVADEYRRVMEQERLGDPSFIRIRPSSCVMAGHKRRLTGALPSVPSPSCRHVFCDVTRLTG